MNRSALIASRIREVFLDGHFVARTNYRELLHDVTLEAATHKIGNLNTIAALCFHINYYLRGLLEVLEGGILDIRDKYSFDLPPLSSEEDWNRLRTDLLRNAEKFAKQVERMSVAQLDEPFVDPKYGTWLRNIEAVIEHSYYHLGQVSMVRKLMAWS